MARRANHLRRTRLHRIMPDSPAHPSARSDDVGDTTGCLIPYPGGVQIPAGGTNQTVTMLVSAGMRRAYAPKKIAARHIDPNDDDGAAHIHRAAPAATNVRKDRRRLWLSIDELA